MKAVYLEAITVVAPGMTDWQHTKEILAGTRDYVAEELPAHTLSLLPANERRRASQMVRLAFRVAENTFNASALRASKQPGELATELASELACVFASADGDLAIAQRLCIALSASEKLVSPTDFHNSVHNAAPGYLSIATSARAPSTALAAGDDSFMVGLLEAISMACLERHKVLLLVGDIPAPMPLHDKRPVSIPAGVGMIITPERTADSLCSLQVTPTSEPETIMPTSALESLRLTNPALRALPLLAQVTHITPQAVVLKSTSQAWRCTLSPA